MKIVMYHCTKRENLENILKNGLLPHKPEGITNSINGVYLSTNPFDWMHYVTRKTTKAGLMIAVDVTGLELMFDDGIDAETWKRHPAFVYPGNISPSRFIRISVSTDKKPAFFDDISDKILKKK